MECLKLSVVIQRHNCLFLSVGDSSIQQWALLCPWSSMQRRPHWGGAFMALATHLDMHRALDVVGGVEHLQPTHVTHVAVEIGAVEAIAALAHGGVWAERLLQLRVGLLLFILLLDQDRTGPLRNSRVCCRGHQTRQTFSEIIYLFILYIFGYGSGSFSPITVKLNTEKLINRFSQQPTLALLSYKRSECIVLRVFCHTQVQRFIAE